MLWEKKSFTGRFGTWQALLFAQLAFVCLLDGLYENLYKFSAFTPKYRCSIPFCEHPQNATYYFGTEKTGDFPIFVERGIPADLLETGESCEYLGISGMPIGMDQEAILNKVGRHGIIRANSCLPTFGTYIL